MLSCILPFYKFTQRVNIYNVLLRLMATDAADSLFNIHNEKKNIK